MAYCLNPHCPDPQNPDVANFCDACGKPLSLAAQYRLKKLLGQSGFGRTFLAERLPTDEERAAMPCVIKQIYNNALAGEAGFQAEAERLQKLGEHRQIPTLLEAIETEQGQFLVQAFVPGENLAEQVEQAGPWTENQVRSLLKSLIPVLQYVHSFDIIHRDIKPVNVVLGGLSNGRTDKNLPMLVDFGSAKWVRKVPAKTVIGSADYAAPEQSIGQATFASDIYSLGLTCLYALTGMPPFSLHSVAEDSWVWRDFLPQPVEPRFGQVLDQMVARSLQQRYESMDQVALDLQFSQNPLLYAPKQLLARAKEKAQEALPPLKNALPSRALAPGPVVVTAPQNWQRKARITQPIGITQALAISPRSPIFATGSRDGTIRLWHLPSYQLIHTFHRRRLIGEGHTGAVTALHFHPDGRALYSASDDGTIKEWDSAERCLLNTLPMAGWTPTGLKVTHDGTQLISAKSDGQIVLWDIATLRPIAQLAQHQQRVNAIALSDRDDLLVSTSNDGTLKLWRYRRGKPQLAKTIRFRSLNGQGQPIAIALHHEKSNSLSASAQSVSKERQLIVADTTGNVQLYPLDAQLNTGDPERFYSSPSPITALAKSRGGCLAIGSEDPVMTLWQVDSGDCVAACT